MVEGQLISESIREGKALDGLQLVATRLSREAIPDATDAQPKVWTLIDFTADVDPDELAAQFAAVLDAPGWYVDFHTAETTYVVFPSKTFRYPRGDASRRAEIVAYGKAAGVPETQLIWND